MSIRERKEKLKQEIEYLDDLGEVRDLLSQLEHHHKSQAKPHVEKCSEKYHLELGERCSKAKAVIDRHV